jgi:hypothetical protein
LLHQLTISYTYASDPRRPSAMLAENDFALTDLLVELTSGATLSPFSRTTETRPALYLGFVRQGETVGFANQPVSIYFAVDAALYGEQPPLPAGAGSPPTLEWEYWNGAGWSRLEREDETQAFSRRGIVTFLGPLDLRASSDFGTQAFWLRARWQSGSYASIPRMRRVLPNTTWATNTLTIEDEILGSGTGEPLQQFQTTHAPVLAGQQIEVSEPDLPPAPELLVIQQEEGDDAVSVVLGADGTSTQIWVRWHRVLDFYASGPRSRHYMLDALTGQIRFGDGQRGLPPPGGTANVRAALYQTGGGTQGNRPAGTLTQLSTSVPYVDGVTNWDAADGGAAQETPEVVKVRGPKTLRHGDRAVTATDVEDLAVQASTEVSRAKAIAADSGDTAGTVTLIIVPTQGSPRPIPSLELLERVRDYVSSRLPATAEVAVAGPSWLRVSVQAQVVPVDFDEAPNVQTAILRRLAAFLDPLAGGTDNQGWAFGRRPHRSELFRLIEATPGVDHVRELAVLETTDTGEPPAAWFLLYPGEHLIAMIGG